MSTKIGFLDRLESGQTIICANGYRTELERRGFLCIGHCTSQAVIDFPARVQGMHEEYVHCGSDVVVACNGHNIKTDCMEDQSSLRQSMRIARSAADKYGSLVAGQVDSTGLLFDQTTTERMKALLTSRVKLAVEEGADFILGQMFNDTREAKMALECINQYGKGLPSVMTLSVGNQGKTADDVPVAEALRLLELSGANVVGLACSRGPSTLMPLMREARALCKGPLAAVPTAYRTKVGQECVDSLMDPLTGHKLYPLDMDPALCSRKNITDFAEEAKSLGIQFVGLCCGAHPSFIRQISDVYERQTPASKYSLDIANTNIFRPNPTPHMIKKRLHQLTQEYKKIHP